MPANGFDLIPPSIYIYQRIDHNSENCHLFNRQCNINAQKTTLSYLWHTSHDRTSILDHWIHDSHTSYHPNLDPNMEWNGEM